MLRASGICRIRVQRAANGDPIVKHHDAGSAGHGWRVAFCLTLLLALGGCGQSSLVKPPEDAVALHQPGDKKLSCRQLDRKIHRLYGEAQRLAPKDFSEDNSNTAAAVVGTFAFTPAYLHILQNELMDKPKQRMRITAITERIEVLRQYKAEKHCYESR